MPESIKKIPLGDMNAETFLQQFWQKKPLLIRQAFPNFETPVSPDELAGLSCEPEVNSRIIIEQGGDHPWQAIHGPMDEDVFANLPETHWSLVVNDMEKYLPELAWITDQFRFIPEWYLDDLLTSYAAPQGSVGPHVDLYDVFILQGSGRRRWHISTEPVAEDNYIPDIAFRLQKEFHVEQEWILEPGDMMYIPSGVSHHGVSLGESLSFSIGFRATSHADLVNDFIAHITENLSINNTYHLPLEPLQKHPNEISAAAIEQVRSIFCHYLDPHHPELARWFGRYVSDPKVDYLPECEQMVESFAQLKQVQQAHGTLFMRHPSSRFAFSNTSTITTDSVNETDKLLFIDGEDYRVSAAFAYLLCDKREIDLDQIDNIASDDERALLIELYNSGKLYQVEKEE